MRKHGLKKRKGNTMTNTYIILGMSCEGCEVAVKTALLSLPEVTAVEVSNAKGEAVIAMSKKLSLTHLQAAFASYSPYKILPKPEDDYTNTGFIYTVVLLLISG